MKTIIKFEDFNGVRNGVEMTYERKCNFATYKGGTFRGSVFSEVVIDRYRLIFGHANMGFTTVHASFNLIFYWFLRCVGLREVRQGGRRTKDSFVILYECEEI